MPLSRSLVVATFLAGVTTLGLQGCGGDDAPARGTDDADRTTPGDRAAGIPSAAGSALTKGAVAKGLPSVVAVSVSENGVTRTGTGTLIAPGTVVTDAGLVTVSSTRSVESSGASGSGSGSKSGSGDATGGTTPRPSGPTPRTDGTTPTTPSRDGEKEEARTSTGATTTTMTRTVRATAAGISVRESNGEEHPGVVDGVDRVSGLAVLRVRALTAVPAATAAPEPVVLGREVAGLAYLSARRPALRPGTIVTTDRAVRYHGTSEVGLFEATTSLGNQAFGGPVVDSAGRVVGITTRSLPSMIPGSVVAIPIGSAQRIAKALAASGRVSRAFLGLETVGVTPTRAAELRLKTSSGAIIRAIVAGSPADFATFKAPTGTTTVGGREIPSGGDVVVGIDKTQINEPEDLDRALANRTPGRRAAIKVIRGDQAVTIRVTLGSR